MMERTPGRIRSGVLSSWEYGKFLLASPQGTAIALKQAAIISADTALFWKYLRFRCIMALRRRTPFEPESKKEYGRACTEGIVRILKEEYL